MKTFQWVFGKGLSSKPSLWGLKCKRQTHRRPLQCFSRGFCPCPGASTRGNPLAWSPEAPALHRRAVCLCLTSWPLFEILPQNIGVGSNNLLGWVTGSTGQWRGLRWWKRAFWKQMLSIALGTNHRQHHWKLSGSREPIVPLQWGVY